MDVRMLGSRDEAVLEDLARRNALFDLERRSGGRQPLAPADADAFVRDPDVLMRVAGKGGTTVGLLLCHLIRTRSTRKLLLREIAVDAARRRKVVGTALVKAMWRWMAAHGVEVAFVLADNPGPSPFPHRTDLSTRRSPTT